MSPRAWQVLSAVALLTSAPAGAATHAELEALVTGPWHHVPRPVSREQQNRDEARCRLIAGQTQVDSTTPAVVEIVTWSAQVNCLQALGYEPGLAPKGTPKTTRKAGLEAVTAAGGGVGITRCDDFNKSRAKPEIEAMFFTWAEGFVTGWNMGLPDKSDLHVDMVSIDKPGQMDFVRQWCEKNPSKRYLEGAVALMARLRQPK